MLPFCSLYLNRGNRLATERWKRKDYETKGTNDVPGGGADSGNHEGGGRYVEGWVSAERGKKSSQAIFQFHETNMYEFKCSG